MIPVLRDLRVQALVVGAIAFGAYLLRLLPDVGFWDTAIFQAAPPVLGLTHPTGYPTYLLLGWSWTTLVPLGSAAFELNLLTAVAAAGAVSMVFVLARQIGAGPIAAAAGALTLAFGLTFWRTAIRADPHPLHVLFALTIIVLLIEWRRRDEDRRFLIAAAFVFGLAMGNHALTALIAPAIALFVLSAGPAILHPRRLAGPLVALVAGLAVYLYVPLRAAADPPIRYDYAPTTWDQFWRYVLGRDFVGGMGFLSLDGPSRAAEEFGTFAASLDSAFFAPVALGLAWLGLVGLIALVAERRTAPIGVLLAVAGGLTLYARLTYANGDLERYALLPLAILAALAALGGQTLAERIAGARPAGAWLVAALLVVPLVLGVANGERVRASSAACYVESVVAEAPADTILVSWWSYSTPIWYAQAVEGARPDLTVVNAGGRQVVEAVAARRGEGRPIVLIQPDTTIDEVRQGGHAVEEMRFCGVGAWLVGPA